ncbi:hypothetical protein [Paraburkholderia phenazinium]|uniref:Uncharacterized protein n=1 Tax=Paraburkholderia phenazinium TaxID=60549 RepID=A0A1N6E1Y9_9BURK|nr:hypothetical protein [Paraburkholderia phenazinium]SIN77048.1 hypothetical protein SAMN05444168_0079 [Paraburkholderia phenazinium]
MARLASEELVRLRQVKAVIALVALTDYAKRDITFVPTKSEGTERWHVAVGASHFELLLNGSKFFDTRAKTGGGGAIDLAIHLYHLSFNDAIGLLRKRSV